MASLHTGIRTYHDHLHRPLEPDLFQVSTKTEPATGPMGIIPIGILNLKLVHIPGAKMIQSDALS